MPRSKESYAASRQSNWPKTTKVTVRIPDELLLKKPEELLLATWIRKAIQEYVKIQ